MTGGRAPDLPDARGVLPVAVGCGLVALGLRLWTLSAMEADNPLFHQAVLDEQVYLEIAAGESGLTDWFLAPLYPWLLGVLGIVTRHGAALANALLGSVVAALAAVGAAHQGRSLLAGVVGGGLVALAGGFVFLDVTVGAETLLSFLGLLSVLALARAAAIPSPKVLAAAGIGIGLATLARGNALALSLAVIPALLAPGDPRETRPPRVVRGGAFAAGLLLVLVTGALVQGLRHDSYSPFTRTGGVNLWMGNGAWAKETMSFGTDEFPLNTLDQAGETRQIAELAEGRELTGSEVSGWWTARALREAAAEPVDTCKHLVRKSVLCFTSDEIGGNHDVIAEREFAPWTRMAPVSVWWILALAAGGWIVARRVTPGADVLGLALFGHFVTLALIFPLSRYRLPVVPLACVLAGAGIGIAVFRRPSRVRAGVAAAAVVLVAVLALAAGPRIRPPARPEAWNNLGEAVRMGALGDPAPWYRRSVADDPTYGPPRERLGHLALDARDNEAALEHFQVAVLSRRTRHSALIGYARALSNLERHEEALRMSDLLLTEYPDDADGHAEGALLAYRAGRREEALRRLDRAIELNPHHPNVIAVRRLLRGR